MTPFDTYLNKQAAEERKPLETLYANIKKIAPETEEYISTGVPALKYNGKYLVSFSASKKHLSLFVMQGDALKLLKDELNDYNTGNRVIRFTSENPIKPGLLKKIIRLRIREIKTAK